MLYFCVFVKKKKIVKIVFMMMMMTMMGEKKGEYLSWEAIKTFPFMVIVVVVVLVDAIFIMFYLYLSHLWYVIHKKKNYTSIR